MSIKLAKEAASINPYSIPKKIKEYGLDPRDKEQREALIEIAKIAAANDGEGISKHIKNYGFDPKNKVHMEALIEIAKIAASESGFGTSNYIQNYGFDPNNKEQSEALIEIAMIAAKRSGCGTSKYIKNCGFDPEIKEHMEALIEIAKIAARQNGRGTSEYIKNYGLDPRNKEHMEALIEIAKIAAANDGTATSRYVENYGLDPEDNEQMEALIEIAKIAARQDGEGTSIYIQNYGFDPEIKEHMEALIEIAKIAARQNGAGTSMYIQNYGLDPEIKVHMEALIEIAKIAARQNGMGTSSYLSNYQLTSSTKTTDVTTTKKGRMSIHSPEEEVWKIVAHRYFSGKLSEIPILKKMPKHLTSRFLFPKTLDLMNDETASKEAALKELKDFYTKELGDRSPFDAFKRYLENVGKAKGGEQHTVQAICWFAITANTLTTVAPEWKKDELETLFKQLATIQDPLLRSEASFLLAADILPSAEKRELYLSLNRVGNSMALPALCLAALGGEEKKLYSIAESLFKVKSSSKKQPAVKDSIFTNLWVKTLLTLIQDNSLSISLKANLLKALVSKGGSKEELRGLLSTLKGMFELKAQEKLQGFEEAIFLSDFLKQKYTEAFKEIIPLSDVEEDKIQPMLQKFRDSQALLKYASSLQQLPDSSLMLKELAACLEKLLDKRFPACRYEESDHLAAVFDSDSSLKKEWTKERIARLAIQISDEKQRVDCGKFILKALEQEHADPYHYSLLVNYLRGNLKDKEAIKQSLKGKQDDPSLALQLALIHLIEDPTDQAFDEVFSQLPKAGEEAYASQFDADIRSLKKQHEQLLKKTSDEGMTIVNTDNAVDLFLCGTEVGGSCQKIDGNPEHNKCLLGYVMDGKNRLLAIKDSSGKIKARSIIRLLWDEEEKKSVLFLERIYPSSAKKEWKQSLEQEAFELAKKLNVSLVSKEVGKGDTYPNPVRSLSSKAPYEYVDASKGVTNGKFVIDGAHLITGGPSDD